MFGAEDRIRYQLKKTSVNNKREKTKVIFVPIRRSAASMTAAPFNMVAIRMSWPGQSTKETWRTNLNFPLHLAWKQGNESS